MKPEQWQMLAAMKMRRLDREYEEVLKAEIKTDANKFEGLAKVLQISPENNKADSEEVKKDGGDQSQDNGEDDGFGDF